MRRIGVKANAEKIFLPRCHERIHYWSQFMRPLFPCREHNRARTRYRPGPRCGTLRPIMSAPAMIEHVQPEARSAIQVSFESESLFLPAPVPEQPLEWDRSGQKANCQLCIFEKA